MLVQRLPLQRRQVECDGIRGILRFAQKIVPGQMVSGQCDKFRIGNAALVREDLSVYMVAQLLYAYLIESR